MATAYGKKQFVSHGLITVDMDMQHTLAKQILTMRSVPEAARIVYLKTVINQNSGADNETATERLCPSIIADGASAAAVTGVRLAGVDVITIDPGRPLSQTGGVVLEVNSPPGYFWHYHKKDGAFPVAVHVLRHLLDNHRNGTL